MLNNGIPAGIITGYKREFNLKRLRSSIRIFIDTVANGGYHFITTTKWKDNDGIHNGPKFEIIFVPTVSNVPNTKYWCLRWRYIAILLDENNFPVVYRTNIFKSIKDAVYSTGLKHKIKTGNIYRVIDSKYGTDNKMLSRLLNGDQPDSLYPVDSKFIHHDIAILKNASEKIFSCVTPEPSDKLELVIRQSMVKYSIKLFISIDSVLIGEICLTMKPNAGYVYDLYCKSYVPNIGNAEYTNKLRKVIDDIVSFKGIQQFITIHYEKHNVEK